MNREDLMNHPLIRQALIEEQQEESMRMARYQANPIAFTHGRQIKGYTLDEACQECSEESMSEVWYARDRRGKKVVIKRPTLLDPEKVKQLSSYVQHEGDVLSRLDHPNIVKLLDMFRLKDPETGMEIPHIVTPELAGEAEDFIKEVPILRSKSTINEEYIYRLYTVMAQSAEGLCYLHSQGLVHCDFNPSQIMFDDDGIVKIIDLSAAREDGEVLAGDDEMMITPHYYPKGPDGEPYAERPFIDPSLDLYAFGMSCLEMLLPVTGMSEEQITRAILRVPEDKLVENVRKTLIVPEYLLSSIVGNCFDAPKIMQDKEFTAEMLRKTVRSFAGTRYLSNRPVTIKDVMTGETIKEVAPKQDYRKTKPW